MAGLADGRIRLRLSVSVLGGKQEREKGRGEDMRQMNVTTEQRSFHGRMGGISNQRGIWASRGEGDFPASPDFGASQGQAVLRDSLPHWYNLRSPGSPDSEPEFQQYQVTSRYLHVTLVSKAKPTYRQQCSNRCSLTMNDCERKGLTPMAYDTIMNKSCFRFMDLPVELRLEIYSCLLVSPDDIRIPAECEAPLASTTGSHEEEHEEKSHPAHAILQTCKLVSEEAIPIFYGMNTFIICLGRVLPPLPSSFPPRRDPTPLFKLTKACMNKIATEQHKQPFFVHNFRWSTLLCMNTVKFHSNGYQQIVTVPNHIGARPYFTCSGYDLIAVLKGTAVLYSPDGPNENMALSISSWVSTKVLYLELDAIQQEMEAILSAE
ncbi:hypothetical protein MBM_09938 [Drepanopeziza brunnea f. sp. 'multigermtubi' MB_m1]|uniref:2EXR domain-containing protein n=1 Tax=Marssonina brunnea f. sp. multigermtubi (strain MB_m1) TaxID=1072389 RepID=K1W4N7_MARBU|nr:uncharacterized protein MBM_09938 [Drepanopeziza brunnea f. sp. 'multigermtubi' MB_m1]EKD11915.1 hypothetical protein MBM_09938 [Drepanopeziza brunnea f. sp. 'multigermtubi' MB_m1]